MFHGKIASYFDIEYKRIISEVNGAFKGAILRNKVSLRCTQYDEHPLPYRVYLSDFGDQYNKPKKKGAM